MKTSYKLDNNLRKHKYKSLNNYLSIIGSLEGETQLFRGQNCDKPLLPKIARNDFRTNTTEKEKKMLAELRRRGSFLIGKDIPDDWDLLVYAQHFGMATRLLDWTSNPLAALWFACCDLKCNSSSYVYCLTVPNDLLLKKKDENPFTIGKTRVFQPNLNNNRIIAQCGWFTAHRYSESNRRFVALEKNPEIKEQLLQIEIPGIEKIHVLKKLDILNVNRQSLFPDFEGVCKYINWMNDIS